MTPQVNTPNLNPATQNLISQYKQANPTATQSSSNSNWYANIKAGAYAPAKPAAPAQQSNPIEDYLSGVKNAATQGAQEVGQGINEAKPVGGADTAGGLVQGVGKILGGAANVIESPVAPVMKPIGDAINAVGDKISDIPAVQQFSNTKAGEDTANVASTVGDYANAAGLIAGGVEGAEKAPEVANTVKDAVKTPEVSPEDAAATKATSDAKQIKSTADDWAKPTTTGKTGFSKATALLKKNPDTSEFLAKQGLDPSAHVENGRFITGDSADALRSTAAQMSHDTLRPSLQMADYSTPKTPMTDIKATALQELEKDKTLTEGDKENAIDTINKETKALGNKNPDGMSLTDMHDNKITYAKNSGYSPIKDPATNIKATANRALASALQKTLEDKAPSSVPVHEFNQYLSKYFKGADYLDALDTKTAPVSFPKQIARAASKLGGAWVGSHLGGLPTEFAGYQIGKALEHAAENISNPMRAKFLSNLEITNPEAFTKVQDFLNKANTGNAGIKQLPPARSIIPEAPSEADQMTARSNQLQRENPSDLSHAQATAPASKNNIANISDSMPHNDVDIKNLHNAVVDSANQIKKPLNAGFAGKSAKQPFAKEDASDALETYKDYLTKELQNKNTGMDMDKKAQAIVGHLKNTKNITFEDSKYISEFLQSKGIQPKNIADFLDAKIQASLPKRFPKGTPNGGKFSK